MDKYNDKFIQSAKNLIEPNENEIKKELKAEADIILKQVKTPLTKYNDRVKPSLLANTSVVTSNTASKNSCQAQAESDYKYNYE
ncbi:hypothetical protein HOG21_02020 [bacterium]|nr:hypothetical protein [bacterium]